MAVRRAVGEHGGGGAAVEQERRNGDVPEAPARRSRWRWLAWGALAVLVVVLGGAAGLFLFGDRVEWGPIASARASAALGRAVAVGSLRVTPGRWLLVELRDARIDNLAGGTRQAMAEVAGVTAEVQATSLLRGPLVIRKLAIDGLDVLLERTADGTRNWRFGPAREAPADAPADRRWFPTLLDARLVGVVTYRTRSGQSLKTEFDGVTIHTTGDDQPVTLTGPGSYHDVPILIESTLGPIRTLRDAATPYPTDLRFLSGSTTLRFEGTMTDPLNVDGAKGRLTVDAPTLDAIYKVAGVDTALDPGLRLAGAFEHRGPRWELTSAEGALGEAGITAGALKLAEGDPDAVEIKLAFDQLDLNAALAGRAKGKRDADFSLAVDRTPDTLVSVELTAKGVAYGTLRLADVRLEAAQTAGKVAVETLAVTYLGGRVKATGKVEAAERRGEADGRVSAEVDVTGLDVQALRQLLDLGTVPLAGRMDGRVAVMAEGATLNAAMRGARISAVAAMSGGSIAREVVEQASTNPLALLRTAKGMSPVSCLVAMVDVRGGAGTVSPLRVRSADGTIVGRGTFDLNRKRLDLVVASESRTTSALALDVPVRLSGSFGNPSIGAARLSASGRAQLAAGDEPGRLLPALQGFARQRACAGR